MKKFLCLALALLFCLTLCACGKKASATLFPEDVEKYAAGKVFSLGYNVQEEKLTSFQLSVQTETGGVRLEQNDKTDGAVQQSGVDQASVLFQSFPPVVPVADLLTAMEHIVSWMGENDAAMAAGFYGGYNAPATQGSGQNATGDWQDGATHYQDSGETVTVMVYSLGQKTLSQWDGSLTEDAGYGYINASALDPAAAPNFYIFLLGA